MDYCIKNNRNVYIKLNDNGCAVTCSKSQMEKFEFSKAKNILSNLPKTLKKMKFKVEAIPDISSKVNETKLSKKTIILFRKKFFVGLINLVCVLTFLKRQNNEKLN